MSTASIVVLSVCIVAVVILWAYFSLLDHIIRKEFETGEK
jgi:hypothetical protein